MPSPARRISIDSITDPSRLKWYFLAGFEIIAFSPLFSSSTNNNDSNTNNNNDTSFSTVLKTNSLLLLAYLAFKLLAFLNQYLAFGPARTVFWDEELVVITGGSQGLGKEIAGLLEARGVRVALLDVRPPLQDTATTTTNEGVVKWYACDVGDIHAVRDAAERIKKDLGRPTILINNAGIVNGKTLLDLSPADVERNFKVNLLSHFNTIQTFLPAMLERPEGGTIVTVASVLGHLGAAQLSDYAAAKAGLIAMHTSLAAEVANMSRDIAPGADNIRTLLVKPGQLSTPLFAGMQTPSDFFGPVVDARDLAAAIVKGVASGRSGVLAMPLYARWIEALFVLPYGAQVVLRKLSGVDRAMARFKPVAAK